MIEYEELQGSTMLKDAPSIINSNNELIDGALDELAGDISELSDGKIDKASPKNADGKDLALAENVLALSGGTMTGAIKFANDNCSFSLNNNDTNIDIGWNFNNRKGAGIGLRSSEYEENSGTFTIYARNETNNSQLEGKADGSLTWDSKNIETVVAQGYANDSHYIRYANGLQICWSSSLYGQDVQITYGVPFKDSPGVSVGADNFTATNWHNTYFVLAGSGYCAWIAIGWWK